MYNKKIINEFELRRNFIKLINEGSPIPNLKALFGMIGRNADELVKSFGDDAVKNIELVMTKALSNKMNVGVDDLGRQCIKSGSGKTLPLETLSSALDGVNLGYFTIDDILTTLPRYLPDGTEFRSVFEKSLSKKVGTTASSSLYKLTQQGEMYKNLLKDFDGFYPFLNTKGGHSGWKFHIYTETLDETSFAVEKLFPIAQKWGAGFKAAGMSMLERLSKNPLQKGKGITFYIPSPALAKNQQQNILKEIQDAIKDLKTSGTITGDQPITKNIGYRYELSKPINTKVGIDLDNDFSTYKALYSPNEGGPYNVPNNPDIF